MTIKEIYKDVLAVTLLAFAWTGVGLIVLFSAIPIMITALLFYAGLELRDE